MTVGIGFTAEEIREFVHDYEVQPFVTKLAWLAGSGVSYERLRNWRSAVFAGGPRAGLVPRKGMAMTIHQGGCRSLERQRARERAEQKAEVARLNGRVEALKGGPARSPVRGGCQGRDRLECVGRFHDRPRSPAQGDCCEV